MKVSHRSSKLANHFSKTSHIKDIPLHVLHISIFLFNIPRIAARSPPLLFGLILTTTFLPVLILAMPRGKYKLPESPLIPGAGVALTVYAASVGFSIWALPVSLMASFGLGSYWIYIELLLSLLLVYHGFSMLLRGGVKEIEIIGKYIYSRLPEDYRNWRK